MIVFEAGAGPQAAVDLVDENNGGGELIRQADQRTEGGFGRARRFGSLEEVCVLMLCMAVVV